MKYTYIILIIASALLIMSCEGPTSSKRYDKDFYYIIAGSLYENEPLSFHNSIYVGKTIPVGGDIEEAFVTDADVVIYDDEGNEYPLQFGIDFETLHFGYYNENLVPQATHTYRIEARVPSAMDSTVIDTVWATTTIPKGVTIDMDTCFTAYEDSVDAYQLVWETAGEEHPMIINTTDGDPVFLYLKYYCLEEWDEVRMVKPIFGEDTFEEEVDYDDPADHYPRLLSFIGEYLPEENGEGGYRVFNSSYQGTLVFFGRYRISVYSVDDNFYHYQYKPDSNFEYGGIHNGYGYFGSASGLTFYTKVVESIE